MSILESMVSTVKRYKSDNFPVLHASNERGEYLYQIKLYSERVAFLSVQSGIMRMQVLLGFIEARAVVIDAFIKSEGTLHYLSVICSSIAHPAAFSQILKKTVPRAIIEEINRSYAEECVSMRAVRDEVWNSIPFSTAILTVNDSRRVLYSLLLEYRALLAEFDVILPRQQTIRKSQRNSDFFVPFLIFEQDGSICGIPEFQIKHISQGGNSSHIIQLQHDFGQRVLVCTDLICIKEIDIVTLSFQGKKSKGMYGVSTSAFGGQFDFSLVVPSFL